MHSATRLPKREALELAIDGYALDGSRDALRLGHCFLTGVLVERSDAEIGVLQPLGKGSKFCQRDLTISVTDAPRAVSAVSLPRSLTRNHI